MKALKFLLVALVIAYAVLISGCQENCEASEACLKAYEKNSVIYDYTGGLPKECLQK